MPQSKTSQRLLKRHTPRPLPRRRRMIIKPTVLIHPSRHKATRRATPVQLLGWTQWPTQGVRERLRFHVVVVLDVGVRIAVPAQLAPVQDVMLR